jgi:hypothetical protein
MREASLICSDEVEDVHLERVEIRNVHGGHFGESSD